jgi:DNA polymerase-3 subunit epsilon
MPPTAEAIHGISDAMVAGQPTVDQVLPSFAAFAAGTVLVAHDAAFDLAFLRHAAARHSVRLDVLGAPVLDTLLLSAALHPDASGHTLDAVAARLGVEVLGRHTALGDALATAEVFVRMLRLLDAQGVTTLADARRLSESTAHARVQRYPEATVTPDTRTLPSM